VVIGGGMAAQRFLEAWVGRAPPGTARITLLCEESTPPYDRVHLGEIVSGVGPVHSLRGSDWYEANAIELRLKETAVAIDRENRRVLTSNGALVAYDRLVLATGSDALPPPVPGVEGPRISLYRTVDDAERIARAVTESRRIVVVGGGLLGLEVADQIRSRGCKVIVLEVAPRLLPRQLDVEGSTALMRILTARGLEIRLATQTRELSSDPHGVTVTLGTGETIEADWAVLAAGTRPREDVAKAAGLACHPTGGVRVDASLTTSDASIFAIGECARLGDERPGLVAPCYRMAEVLADRWTGGQAEYCGAPADFRLKIAGVEVHAVGESAASETGVRNLTWSRPGVYRRVVSRNGELVGAIAVGGAPNFARMQQAIARHMRVTRRLEARVRKTGSLWRTRGAPPIASWPQEAVVCSCTGVTCGALRLAWAEGCRSSTRLSESTGAGTSCGSCKPMLAELAGEVASARPSGVGWGLPFTACLALVLFGVAAAVGPIPMSRSVLDANSIDFLWRDAWWKQASGFTLLALTLGALLLPIREKLPGALRTSFSKARVFHSLLGVATVVALGVHTGLRMGTQLNAVLMGCVILLIAFGSMAGLVASTERWMPARLGATLRLGWKRAHLLLFWPVPVLVLFHVLAVYFY